MDALSIKVENYKCFGEETGFEEVRRVNLIIGRNNSGKSSLLDLIEAISLKNYQFDTNTWRHDHQPRVIFESRVSEEVASRTFPASTSGGKIRMSHGEYGKKYIGRKIKWTRMGTQGASQSQLIECDDTDIHPPLSQSGDYIQRLPNSMPIFLEGKQFRRLLAERDIIPEQSLGGDIKIHTNGIGITNAIQCFINKTGLPSDLVERDMLNALNSIFAHDALFTDIVCQEDEKNKWEIYLEEEHKGRIPLSQSGSGLKTVISVLACLILVPHLEKKSLNHYVFGFEELENNIHPALLRRLNDYIYQMSVENDFVYFLTTHSNVLIDQFSKQSDAQIVHVTSRGSYSTCTTAKTYIQNNGILDDLDIRASDILQANGIIWVEGPSDRIYINRWIDLWSNGELKEGTHYQVIFYGGRLLAHLSAEIPDEVEASVSILATNRNAIILIDSDKRSKQSKINQTKIRLRSEFEKLGALCWITKGKEIENYIPSEVVDDFWDLKNSKQVDQYADFFGYLNLISSNQGDKYRNKKTLLAEKIVAHMTKENMSNVLDINKQMEIICKTIDGWNS